MPNALACLVLAARPSERHTPCTRRGAFRPAALIAGNERREPNAQRALTRQFAEFDCRGGALVGLSGWSPSSVLSIGKLAAGQAKYYLDQAEVRVDVVQSVGQGVEDYYLGPTEARGQWIGAAARELGLDGGVAPEALRRVLAGLDPRDGTPLRSSSSPARIAGFDLTFSAPKSVSLLFGLGDPELRGFVRKAHDLGVR
jgi:hypothetical protein